MIMFYSGAGSRDHLPERVLADTDPGVMLTYYGMYSGKGETVRRLMDHIKRRQLKRKKESTK